MKTNLKNKTEKKHGINIKWLGHGSVEIKIIGKTILCDPLKDGNPSCNLSLDDIGKVDIICVKHGHIDHIGDSPEIVNSTLSS